MTLASARCESGEKQEHRPVVTRRRVKRKLQKLEADSVESATEPEFVDVFLDEQRAILIRDLADEVNVVPCWAKDVESTFDDLRDEIRETSKTVSKALGSDLTEGLDAAATDRAGLAETLGARMSELSDRLGALEDRIAEVDRLMGARSERQETAVLEVGKLAAEHARQLLKIGGGLTEVRSLLETRAIEQAARADSLAREIDDYTAIQVRESEVQRRESEVQRSSLLEVLRLVRHMALPWYRRIFKRRTDDKQ
jgi:hypothetical protein